MLTNKTEEMTALKRFNFSVFLHFIGRLLYRTFVPIILLKNWYSIDQVFIYLIGYSLVTVLFSILSIKFLSKKRVLLFYILAILSEILLIILLIPEKINYLIFWLIILAEWIYYSYYYISYNSIVAHYTSKEKTSKNLWNLGIASGFANIFTPIVGALLLMISKNLFSVVAVVFLVFSVIPLLKIINKDINWAHLPKIKIKDIRYELFSCGIRSWIEFWAFILWPIFVYISGFSLIYVGIIPAIEALTNIILLHTIKNKIISNKFRTISKITWIFWIIFISIYRFFFPEQMIFTNFLTALFFTIFSLSINADYFEKIKNYQTYYSSMLLESVWLWSWALVATITFFIGLKYGILIPVVLATIWLIFSFKEIKK